MSNGSNGRTPVKQWHNVKIPVGRNKFRLNKGMYKSCEEEAVQTIEKNQQEHTNTHKTQYAHKRQTLTGKRILVDNVKKTRHT